jgi:putative membrane protein
MNWPLAVIALGYGVYLLYGYAAGVLYFYINPIYIIPTALTGAVLVLLGLIVALAPRPRRGAQTHSVEFAVPAEHEAHTADEGRADHPRISWLTLGLLVLPLVCGFALAPKPLGVSTAAQRGVEVTPLGRVDDVVEFRVSSRPETYNIKDWVAAMRSDPDPESLAGKAVRVSGFVYRDSRLPDGWFLVARFVVQCCAVDATPIGLPVRTSGDASPKEGAWVAVDGAWDVAEIGRGRKAVVSATSITPIERPDRPYLY